MNGHAARQHISDIVVPYAQGPWLKIANYPYRQPAYCRPPRPMDGQLFKTIFDEVDDFGDQDGQQPYHDAHGAVKP